MRNDLPLWRRFGPVLLLWIAAPFPLYLWAGIALACGLR